MNTDKISSATQDGLKGALNLIAAMEPERNHNSNVNDLIAVRAVSVARTALRALSPANPPQGEIAQDDLIQMMKERITTLELTVAALTHKRAQPATALVETIRQYVRDCRQCGCGPGLCRHDERDAILDGLLSILDETTSKPDVEGTPV